MSGQSAFIQVVFFDEQAMALDQQNQSFEDLWRQPQITAVAQQATLCRIKMKRTECVGKPGCLFFQLSQESLQ
jgi:hypothetical protein